MLVVWGPPYFATIAPLGINGATASGLVAAVLAVPGLFLVAMVAPLVGYRRRDWLFNFVPFVGLFMFYEIGARIADLSNGRTHTDNGNATPAPALR